MKKHFLLLFVASSCLASCAKTNLLYDDNAYNSPIFDENYYTNWEGIDNLEIRSTTTFAAPYSSFDGLDGLNKGDVGNYKWSGTEEEMWGYHNNLDLIEPAFSYGVLSKLYDGRVRCDGYYQKSRVQLNKTGYATYFPKSLLSTKFIAFAARGGTSTPQSLLDSNDKKGLLIDFKMSFYIHINNDSKYDKVVFEYSNVPLVTDAGGATNLVSFYLADIKANLANAVAMSLEWECKSDIAKYNITDDYKDKEKDHLAVMLYEVFLGQSTWH